MSFRGTIGQMISGAAAGLFALGLMVMVAITGISMWMQTSAQLKGELKAAFVEVEATFSKLASETKAYSGMLARHPAIVAAVAADQPRLGAALAEEYTALKHSDREIDVVEVLGADGVVLHRAHNPPQRGDNKSKQPLVASALKDGRANALTISSTTRQLAYVAMEAIRSEGRVVGFVAVGKRVTGAMLQRLEASTHAQVSILLDGQFVASTQTEITQAAFDAQALRDLAGQSGSLTLQTPGAKLFAYASPVALEGQRVVLFVLSRDQRLITDRFTSFIFWPLILGLLALLLMTPLLIIVGRRFSRLFDDLCRAMSALASGMLSAVIPHLARKDELGDMARAVQVFQSNALKMQGLDAERAAEEAQRAARLKALEEFNEATRIVIAAAARGELSARVDRASVPPDLEALAESLNTLLDSFDETIAATVSGLETIARGELTSRIPDSFNGEFGRMTSAANTLAERFQGTIGDIVSVTQDVTSATDEILMGVTDLSQRTAQQAEISEQTISRLSSFAGTFRNASSMASSAAKMADDAEVQAGAGERFVVQTREAMGRISGASQRISDITTIIADVAFQTNLLALNAAVEAARAGEAGRGFAVVAVEVRALAERAAEASRSVKQLVDGAIVEIDTGVDAVEQTEDAFRKIAGAIKAVAGLVRDMAGTTGSQAQSVDQLGNEVERLGEMAQQNAALVEQSNAMLENANARIGDLSRLARQFQIADAEPQPHRRAA